MARKSESTLALDKAIGDKISKLRRAKGLSRQQLAVAIDVTHQQLQKYENGTNRIAASRLPSLAKALNKPIAYFFEDLEAHYEAQTVHQRMTLEVARNFALIKNPGHQSVIHSMIREFARNG